MSTNLSCNFYQAEPERWYYVLEDDNAPEDSWDWREYATAYGPFGSEAESNKHLFDNHANPGGSEIHRLPLGITKLDLSKDPVLKRMIDDADIENSKSAICARPRWA